MEPSDDDLTGRETSTLSLLGLLDLLDALSIEIEALPGLAPIWAAELRRDLIAELYQSGVPINLRTMRPPEKWLRLWGRAGFSTGR